MGRATSHKMQSIPNFFIVGQPKSGTTGMHKFLGQHPEIFVSPEKEPHHFDLEKQQAAKRRNRGPKGMYYASREHYLDLFNGHKGERIVCESSTGYLYSKSAAREIAKFNPKAKILMFFREPVDFIYSYHNALLRSANESVTDFREALALEDERKLGRSVPWTTTFPDNLFYSEHVKYFDQAKRYFDVFPRSQIMVLFYDDFRSDNELVYSRVLDFLGVDRKFSPVFEKINPSQTIRASRLARWLAYYGEKSPYSLKRWIPSLLLLPIRFVLKHLTRRNIEPEALDDAHRNELMRKFRPEVVRLGEYLDVDLCKKWGYD